LVLGLAIAAMGLSGCGRKGGLDPPPSAAAPQAAPQSTPAAGLSPIGNAPQDPADQRTILGERAGVVEGRAVAPVGEKRRIPLDALID
jgi:predicted small lipoprotein YifL